MYLPAQKKKGIQAPFRLMWWWVGGWWWGAGRRDVGISRIPQPSTLARNRKDGALSYSQNPSSMPKDARGSTQKPRYPLGRRRTGRPRGLTFVPHVSPDQLPPRNRNPRRTAAGTPAQRRGTYPRARAKSFRSPNPRRRHRRPWRARFFQFTGVPTPEPMRAAHAGLRVAILAITDFRILLKLRLLANMKRGCPDPQAS